MGSAEKERLVSDLRGDPSMTPPAPDDVKEYKKQLFVAAEAEIGDGDRAGGLQIAFVMAW